MSGKFPHLVAHLHFTTTTTHFPIYRATVTFSKGLPENVMMLVYGQYPSVIKISKDRTIETNFAT